MPATPRVSTQGNKVGSETHRFGQVKDTVRVRPLPREGNRVRGERSVVGPARIGATGEHSGEAGARQPRKSQPVPARGGNRDRLRDTRRQEGPVSRRAGGAWVAPRCARTRRRRVGKPDLWRRRLAAPGRGRWSPGRDRSGNQGRARGAAAPPADALPGPRGTTGRDARSIEGHRDRLTQGHRLGETNQHAAKRHRLKSDPVAAAGQQHGQQRQQGAGPLAGAAGRRPLDRTRRGHGGSVGATWPGPCPSGH